MQSILQRFCQLTSRSGKEALDMQSRVLPLLTKFSYGLSFAAFTCVPVHVFLWHYKEIKDGIMGRAKLDIHARLMRKYPKTPWYWFAAITV